MSSSFKFYLRLLYGHENHAMWPTPSKTRTSSKDVRPVVRESLGSERRSKLNEKLINAFEGYEYLTKTQKNDLHAKSISQ